jgi:hypothetical protein
MKTLRAATMIVAFLLLCSYGSQAQNAQTKLNQVDLAKQFVGSWTGEIAKDTILMWDIKSIGTGEECDYKYITKGRTIIEGKQLWGYVKGIDKYIIAVITEKPDIEIYAFWFTTKNKYLMLQYGDISNPEKADIKYEGEFKSPETYVETFFMNNKPVKTYGYKRVK